MAFCAEWNRAVFNANTAFFDALPARMTYHDLDAALAAMDLQLGVCAENIYRRASVVGTVTHRVPGTDLPSGKRREGNKLLNCEGNWRDIFQNPALPSIPCFGANMISSP